MNEPASQDEGTAGALHHRARGLLGAGLRVAPANYPVKGQVNTHRRKTSLREKDTGGL